MVVCCRQFCADDHLTSAIAACILGHLSCEPEYFGVACSDRDRSSGCCTRSLITHVHHRNCTIPTKHFKTAESAYLHIGCTLYMLDGCDTHNYLVWPVAKSLFMEFWLCAASSEIGLFANALALIMWKIRFLAVHKLCSLQGYLIFFGLSHSHDE